MLKLKSFLSVIVFMLVFVTSTSCSSEKSNAQSDDPQVLTIKSVTSTNADKAQDFTFEIDGKTHSFLEYTKGKVVFLNFWGTWCPPCRKEIPDIIEIQKEYKDKDFVVIGIALERPGGDPVQQVKTFADAQGINYMNFTGDRNIIGQIVNAYGGITGVPTTFIIDREAKIHRKIVGMRSKSQFLNDIKPIL